MRDWDVGTQKDGTRRGVGPMKAAQAPRPSQLCPRVRVNLHTQHSTAEKGPEAIERLWRERAREPVRSDHSCRCHMQTLRADFKQDDHSCKHLKFINLIPSLMQTRKVYQLDFNQDYNMFTLRLLIYIIVWGSFP